MVAGSPERDRGAGGFGDTNVHWARATRHHSTEDGETRQQFGTK